jgi:hypothetical protein
MSADKDLVIATLAAAIITVRGKVEIADIQQAWTDAAEVVTAAQPKPRPTRMQPFRL